MIEFASHLETLMSSTSSATLTARAEAARVRGVVRARGDLDIEFETNYWAHQQAIVTSEH